MSSSNAYFVVPFLIFLASSSACNARPIGVSNLEPTKNSQLSTKNDGKSSVARVSIPSKVVLPNKSEAAENGSFLTETTVHEDWQTLKPVTKSHQESQGPEATPAIQIKPLATVSWKLPKRKRGEKQPGFNLDYAPPKTHPPVHN